MDERILVLDDEPGITLLCSRLLKRAGYEVVAFTESTPAFEHLRKNQVDLLLVDIRMRRHSRHARLSAMGRRLLAA